MFRDYIVKILGNSPTNTPLKEVYGDLQEEVNDLYKEDYKYHCQSILFTDIEPLFIENCYLDINNNIYKAIRVDKFREHIEIYLLHCNFVNIKVNGVDKKVLIDEVIQQIQDKDEKIVLSDFKIETGSLIEYQDSKWIVISESAKDVDLYRCRISKMEDIIKFIIDGKVQEIPCLIEYQNMTVQENSMMSLADGNIRLSVSDNEITKKLKVGDTFIKFRSKFEIIGFGGKKGLVYIFTKKTQIGSEDDMVNEIADRWKTETKHDYSIEVENVLNLKLNDTKQLNVVVKDNGNVVSLPLIYTSSDNTIATISENGLINCIKEGACNIKVALKDYESISQTISLTVKSAEQITYEFSPTSNIVAFGMSKTYTVYKMIDSVKQADTFIFRMNLNGKDPKICEFIVVDGNKFTINAKKNIRIAGTITIELIDTNNVVITTKDFIIKNV